MVDLTPVMEVCNILMLSQLGAETGSILADILLGRQNPSGKLAATWAAWRDYPDLGQFGELNDTRYNEGIYVGYRYFDSVQKEPLFPFGFGLSYTKFEIGEPRAALDGEQVSVTARVKNTGAYPGKEVVQLYVSIPAGKLDEPYQTLCGFEKTGVLAPGKECSGKTGFYRLESACAPTRESEGYRDPASGCQTAYEQGRGLSEGR